VIGLAPGAILGAQGTSGPLGYDLATVMVVRYCPR